MAGGVRGWGEAVGGRAEQLSPGHSRNDCCLRMWGWKAEVESSSSCGCLPCRLASHPFQLALQILLCQASNFVKNESWAHQVLHLPLQPLTPLHLTVRLRPPLRILIAERLPGRAGNMSDCMAHRTVKQGRQPAAASVWRFVCCALKLMRFPAPTHKFSQAMTHPFTQLPAANPSHLNLRLQVRFLCLRPPHALCKIHHLQAARLAEHLTGRSDAERCLSSAVDRAACTRPCPTLAAAAGSRNPSGPAGEATGQASLLQHRTSALSATICSTCASRSAAASSF